MTHRTACPFVFLFLALLTPLLVPANFLDGQTPPAPALAANSGPAAIPAPAAPAPAASASRPTESVPADTHPTPSWYSNPDARTYEFSIPAPRGQIVDRKGVPLAVNRLGYDLEMKFPTDQKFEDKEALFFARRQIFWTENVLKRKVDITDEVILEHYRNRRRLPLSLFSDLPPAEVETLRKSLQPALNLRPVYYRLYPQGIVAGAIVGYVGRERGRILGEMEPREPIWSRAEGREGLEETFNQQLRGRDGILKVTEDEKGKITSEAIVQRPLQGYNLVTTLDLDMQKLCEKTLADNVKRGAVVIMDPRNGDLLAAASWPSFDPNRFIPSISSQDFALLNNDKTIPLLPRAFRSSYPPGSTFKVITGLAAFETGTIEADSYFGCPPAFRVGNYTFHNHRSSDSGSLTFREALAQSCNTWFYNVGIQTGGQHIVDAAFRCGLGRKTGLPLRGEVSGRIPTDEYMLATHKRKILDGDVANISIGQGDILVTPVQMAQVASVMANGGTLYQARLVQQLQSINDTVEFPYPVRARDFLGMKQSTVEAIHSGMEAVINGPGATGGRAAVPKIKVAGKTGTAQWGPKAKHQIAAWFIGYAPADAPRYAWAAMVEGDPGQEIQGGRNAAPLIGKIMKEIFAKEPPPPKDDAKDKGKDDDDNSDDEKPRKPRRPRPAETAEEDIPVRRAIPVNPAAAPDPEPADAPEATENVGADPAPADD